MCRETGLGLSRALGVCVLALLISNIFMILAFQPFFGTIVPPRGRTLIKNYAKSVKFLTDSK